MRPQDPAAQEAQTSGQNSPLGVKLCEGGCGEVGRTTLKGCFIFYLFIIINLKTVACFYITPQKR